MSEKFGIEIDLLAARATNGTPGGVQWMGGEGLLSIFGTFNGGDSVQIAYSPNQGGNYVDTDGGSFTGQATLLLKYPPGLIRATVAGAGVATSISAKLQKV